jgi:hypothetical protein
MKRILSLATVAALMVVMLVVMATAALAVPPASRELGCTGGTDNANHAANQSSISDNMKADEAPRSDQARGSGPENQGTNNATSTPPLAASENCRNDPPEHPHA